MTRVLVTGGAGFIGSHVAQAFVKIGADVVCFDNLQMGKLENVPDGATLVRGDVKDVDQVVRVMRDIDVVIMCHGQVSVPVSTEQPLLDIDINVRGTLNVLEACRKARLERVVFAGSRSEYGEPKCLPVDEEHSVNPNSVYAASKAAASRYCLVYNMLYGLPTVILRLSNVYGPRAPYWARGSYAYLVWFVYLVLKGEPIEIFGDGEQVRDNVWIKDCVEAFVEASKNPMAIGQVFNICTGEGLSLKRVVQKISEQVGKEARIKYAPPRRGDVRQFVGSPEKAGKILDWKPRTTFDEGLRKTISWVKEEIRLGK